jgi:hypothetical protein
VFEDPLWWRETLVTLLEGGGEIKTRLLRIGLSASKALLLVFSSDEDGGG